MSYNEKDVKRANYIVQKFDGAFITGSFITNPETSNDVDVVVPAWNKAHTWLIEAGFKDSYDNPLEEFTEKVDQEGEKYEGAYELEATYRRDGLNVLIIDRRFYPAYLAAKERMTEIPKLFQTRDERVALHMGFKDVIKGWFND